VPKKAAKLYSLIALFIVHWTFLENNIYIYMGMSFGSIINEDQHITETLLPTDAIITPGFMFYSLEVVVMFFPRKLVSDVCARSMEKKINFLIFNFSFIRPGNKNGSLKGSDYRGGF
jgi:hypothetical protein